MNRSVLIKFIYQKGSGEEQPLVVEMSRYSNA